MSYDPTQINAFVGDIGPRLVADAVARDSSMFDLFRSRGMIRKASNPKGPRWDVQTSGLVAATYVPGGTISATTQTTTKEAALQWGNHICSVDVAKQTRSIWEAAQDGGTALIEDFFGKNFADQGKAIAKVINTGMLTGSTDGETIIGIASIIAASGTYAGIDRAAVTAFACYIAANSGTPRALTVALMDAAVDYFRNSVLKAELGPNWVIFTGTAQATAMRGFSTGAVTPYVVAPVVNGLVPEGVPQLLSKAKIQYRGMPVIEFPGYPTGRVDFLDLDGIWLETLNDPEDPFSAEPGADVNGDIKRYSVHAFMQLVCPNPRLSAFSLQDLS